MTYRVGPKGQVVLPKAIRDRLGITPGDEVLVDEVEGEIRIRRPRSVPSPRGILRDGSDPMPLTRALELDRRWDRAHDEQHEAEWALRDAESAQRDVRA